MKGVVRTTREARMLGAVAILACGLTLIVASLFDPFGREAERADGSARRAAGTILCIQQQTFQLRLNGLTALEHSGQTLSGSDENLKDVLVRGLDLFRIAAADLDTVCPPIP